MTTATSLKRKPTVWGSPRSEPQVTGGAILVANVCNGTRSKNITPESSVTMFAVNYSAAVFERLVAIQEKAPEVAYPGDDAL